MIVKPGPGGGLLFITPREIKKRLERAARIGERARATIDRANAYLSGEFPRVINYGNKSAKRPTGPGFISENITLQKLK